MTDANLSVSTPLPLSSNDLSSTLALTAPSDLSTTTTTTEAATEAAAIATSSITSSISEAKTFLSTAFTNVQNGVLSYLANATAEPDELQYCRRLCEQLFEIRKRRGQVGAKKEAIICLVGATSAGKSALIKALVRIPHDDQTVQVRRTAHTTLFPSCHSVEDDNDSVLHFCDLPGTHGVLPSPQMTERFLTDLKKMVTDCCSHADLVLYCFSHYAILDYMKTDVAELMSTHPRENIIPVLTKSDLLFRGYSKEKNQGLLERLQRDLGSHVNIFPTVVLGFDPEDEESYGNLQLAGVNELRHYLLLRLQEMKLLPPSFLEKLRSGEYQGSIMWTTISLAALGALVVANPVATSSVLAVMTNYVALPTAASFGAVVTATALIAGAVFARRIPRR